MTKPWMCWWERKFFQNKPEWMLVHDGQQNPCQFEFRPEEVRFYTRTYRLILKGGPVNTWVKWIYDLREEEATVEATFHEPGGEDETMTFVKEAVGGRQTG